MGRPSVMSATISLKEVGYGADCWVLFVAVPGSWESFDRLVDMPCSVLDGRDCSIVALLPFV